MSELSKSMVKLEDRITNLEKQNELILEALLLVKWPGEIECLVESLRGIVGEIGELQKKHKGSNKYIDSGFYGGIDEL